MFGVMYSLLDDTVAYYNTLNMLHIDLEIMSESQTGRKRSARRIWVNISIVDISDTSYFRDAGIARMTMI